MLTVIDNLLDAALVQQWRAALAAAPWQDGALTAGSIARRVKANQQLPDECATAVSLRTALLARLAQHPRFLSAALPQRIYPPKFNRYQDGGHYGDHVDNAVLPLADGTRLRSDVSCTLFLSAPEDYDGGELVIQDAGGAARAVKLAAGSLVLYPATSVHHVTPVTRGTRYAAFFWVQSLVRESTQRALLFELDSAIQQVTQDFPASSGLVALTGVYHNLVRRWADP
ncbi:MAG: Fe2+-dependent dioxygenase [Moraxellaceae bacterium]